MESFLSSSSEIRWYDDFLAISFISIFAGNLGISRYGIRRGKKLVKAWILGAIVGFLLRRVVHLIYDPAVVSAVPFLLFISSGFFKGCFSFWGLMQTWSCVVADPLVNGRTNVFENFIHATIAIELKTGLRVPYWHILTGFAGMLIAAILYPWFH